MLRWCVGVMTVTARRKDLLPKTLASLKAGGWSDLRLFVDGEKDASGWESEFGFATTCWGAPNLKAAGAWEMALRSLLIRNPTAERYMLAQDDFVCYRNLRGYLESCKYPEMGYWNTFSFPSNESFAPKEKGKPKVGWYESRLVQTNLSPEKDPHRFQTGRGAVCLVFSREAVLTLFSSKHLAERPCDPARGTRAIDGGVAAAMNVAGWREMVHWPSLTQHTGERSTMGHMRHPESLSFRGEHYDAMQLLKERSDGT